MFKVKNYNSLYIRTYAAKSPHSTINKACGVHGETQDTPIDYYDNDIDESNTDKVNTLTEEPLLITSYIESREGRDIIEGHMYTSQVRV